MEVDSVGIIGILSMSYITTCIVKKYTSLAEIRRGPVKNQITTLTRQVTLLLPTTWVETITFCSSHQSINPHKK